MESRNSKTPAEVLEEKLKELDRKKHPFAKKGKKPHSGYKSEYRYKRGAERTPKQVLEDKMEESRRTESWILLGKKLAATVLTVYLLLGVVFGLAVVRGQSMYPNLKTGDMVFFFRLDKSYQSGNLVILDMPNGEELVKRVVAVEGDTVDVDKDTGLLMINEQVLKEEYIFRPTYEVQGGTEFPVTVPKGSVFVLGDNRTVSSDSREFGIISVKKIDGKVFSLFRLYEVER